MVDISGPEGPLFLRPGAPLNREMTSFVWTLVCPEVMSGFGVPREPVRLSGGNGNDLWKGTARMKNRSGQDLAERIRAGCQEVDLQEARRIGAWLAGLPKRFSAEAPVLFREKR